jgi:type II secretory pathway component PulC
MKQDLWLANSSLVVVFLGSLALYNALEQEPLPFKPVVKIEQPVEVEKKKEEEQPTATVWEKIYQDDMFGTYVAPDVKPVKQSLITPIPEPKPPVIPPPPEPKKQEFIPPLTITVHGIIAGSDEAKNVAMIADETNKEGMYHLGERVKDAQIIKIAHNRVVLLRANGQQEIFYLRKEDLVDEQTVTDKWKYIVKRVDDQTFDVDPASFSKEIVTLGNFMENTAVVGTAYAAGKPMGIRIGKLQPLNAGTFLGLMENDIITSVNDMSVSNAQNRISIYETLTKAPLGTNIKVGLNRAGADILFTYRLAKIERPHKTFLFGVSPAAQQQQPTQPETGLPMNRLQQREQTMRDFTAQHFDPDKHKTTVMEIRERILNGLRERLRKARSR